MFSSHWLILLLGVWLLWSLFAHWIIHNPRGDIVTGLVWHAFRIYGRLFHHTTVLGREHIPTSSTPGPLIVVSNHTAGVDPILIQNACPFFIRWMMASDMQLASLEAFWSWLDIISVDRQGREVVAARQAIRHLAANGVLGIFPEGTLERPAEHILPFLPGVGLIIKKSKAPVLPVVITGTPQVDPAWASLWKQSSATVRFLEPISYADTSLKPAQIASDLRKKLSQASGFPLCDTPAPAAIDQAK